MRPWERRSFNAFHIVVAGTGFGYLFLKYFGNSDSPFDIIQHPWQTPLMAIHIVAAAGFAVLFGILLHSHILPRLRRSRPENRLTGLIAFSSFITMALSGYLLQVSSSLLAVQIWMWTHIIAGFLFVVIYSLHLVFSKRIIEARQRTRAIHQSGHV